MDVTIPAVLRPDVLDAALASCVYHLWGGRTDGLRLIINIDPVGPGSRDEVTAVCRRYFPGRLKYRFTEQGSLNEALRWLWFHVKSDVFFYTEDDVHILRDVDWQHFQKCFAAHPEMASLQLPQHDMPALQDFEEHGVRQVYIGDGVFRRGGQYKVSLQPRLLRRDFAARAAALIHNEHDPEIQFHKSNPVLTAWAAAHEFGTYAVPGQAKIVKDSGVASRLNSGSAKMVWKGQTKWVPMKLWDLYGQLTWALDVEPGSVTWRECEARKWRAQSFEVIDRFLTPDMVYVDVGAYVGTLLLYAGRIARRCLGFEPDPECFPVLAHNVALNKANTRNAPLAGLVMPSCKAISPRGGVLKFGPGPGGFGSSRSSFVYEHKPTAVAMDTLTLADAMKVHDFPRVDYLKWITQGSEPEILTACLPILRRDKPVLHVTVQPCMYEDRAEGLDLMARVLSIYDHVYDESGTAVDPDSLRGPEWQDVGERILVATDRPWL